MLDQLKQTAETGKNDVMDLASMEVKKTKLIVADGLSQVSVNLMTFAIVFFFVTIVLFFFAMGLAFLLDDVLQIPGAGFFIMGTIFSLALLLFFVFRKKWVELPIVKMYLKLLFRNNQQEEEI